MSKISFTNYSNSIIMEGKSDLFNFFTTKSYILKMNKYAYI